ncbi:MAG TPA: hypothetical protein VFT39_20735 [Vicinamibacterales bacterium]|nr:hypothetical protein [Vicinamibacterales bacterium]
MPFTARSADGQVDEKASFFGLPSPELLRRVPAADLTRPLISGVAWKSHYDQPRRIV